MNKPSTMLAAGLALLAGIPLALVAALLIIDGNQTSPTCVTTVATGSGALNAQQYANATTITRVAEQLSLPSRAAVIAVATAMQESGLYNLDHGDRDSLGLFQQRPSQGWGSPAQILNPTYASAVFYGHLIAVPGWQTLPVTVAAQDVQRSAFPDAYARWEALATATVTHILGTTFAAACPANAQAVTGSERGAEVVGYAARWLGTPYAYGGGNAHGPSRGFCAGTGGYLGRACLADKTVGFDCSGLTLYAYAQVGITLGHYTGDQWNQGTHVTRAALQPGDLVFFATNPANPATIHHVGLYIGDNEMIDAPTTGTTVRVEPIWDSQYAGAVRP